MFADWIKVGDVILWDDDPEAYAVFVVLDVGDLCMFILSCDTLFRTTNGIEVFRPESAGWNKRSHWKKLGWKFL